MLNLFVNAHQAVGDGGHIVIRTRSSVSSAGTDVFIEVHDDGHGMPKEILDRIFEPFFTTKERGTGLGLATVRSITDEARGHLTVDSTPGEGTTVRLIFPQATNTLTDGVAGGADRGASALDQSACVLIVDRDDGVRGVMAVALRRHGFQVLEAPGVTDALSVLVARQGGVDVVILDGDQVDEWRTNLEARLRGLCPDARIVVTSTHAGGENRELAGFHVLPKPFSIGELVRAVRPESGERSPGRRRSGPA